METEQVENERQPRLYIADLLVGVLVAAVWCATNNPSFAYPERSQQFVAMRFLVVRLLLFFSGSAGLFLFARRWFFGRETDFQPGHWWLCLVGITVLFLIVAELVKWNLAPLSEIDRQWNYKFLIGLQVGMIGIQWLSGMLLPVRKIWWLTLIPFTLINIAGIGLWAAILAGYTQHGVHYHERIQPLLLILDLGMILAVSIWDAVTTTNRRDWLHWWGIGTAMMLSGNELTLRFVYWFGWVR